MKLQTIISRALKANPETANLTIEDGVAIVFNGTDGIVYTLKVAMPEGAVQSNMHHGRAKTDSN
jgi:hypothetical protein